MAVTVLHCRMMLCLCTEDVTILCTSAKQVCSNITCGKHMFVAIPAVASSGDGCGSHYCVSVGF